MAGHYQVFYPGGSARMRADLERAVGAGVVHGVPAEPAAGDVVFLDVAASDGVPLGNAFSGCRALKQHAGVRVYLLIQSGDSFSAEIARFCLADACFEVAPDGGLSNADDVRARLSPHRLRFEPAGLLAELERRLRSDEGAASVIQKLLATDRQEWILEHLTDPETGLFAGPFASFKLDEEFKRAHRFHQPLSLLLLDIGAGPPAGAETDDRRRAGLAEVASVLLNECRDIDVLARFTETTFALLLPGTGVDGASHLGRRLLAALGVRRDGGGDPAPAIGIATVPAADIADRRAFLARAEACLRIAQERVGEGRIYAAPAASVGAGSARGRE
jgi:GGDEF domain-containing protein